MAEIFNSFCARLCSGTCGILVTRKGQTITEVKGDPAMGSANLRGVVCKVYKA